ncbi:conserved hypothetical protein [Talaromyces marneffei ATCC 18224]|uniref:Uncharacterized protein n=2 Tax=Talaromyces marneffei TaxID=37727 RepID=B6Q2Y2_TALMQ|nr:conserved hypothetical protein [Talaromyces marneffei ATCC 18224]
MPPRTRKVATASSSNAVGRDEKAVVAGPKSIDAPNMVLEDNVNPDHKTNIVVDEDEEGMELFETSDGGRTAINLPSKDEQRAFYAVGGGGGGYNALKKFHGQVYSGMAIGGSHNWNYDQGVWKETKVEPDRWEIDYTTTKRRARKAPRGSGVPIGTEYHWLIVGHQYVEKQDDNTYETNLVGSKYKLAHKSTSATAWSVPTVKAQREREIDLLEDAERRVQGLPPVLTTEKVKVSTKQETGQQTLDTLFTKGKERTSNQDPRQAKERKVEIED